MRWSRNPICIVQNGPGLFLGRLKLFWSTRADWHCLNRVVPGLSCAARFGLPKRGHLWACVGHWPHKTHCTHADISVLIVRAGMHMRMRSCSPKLPHKRGCPGAGCGGARAPPPLAPRELCRPARRGQAGLLWFWVPACGSLAINMQLAVSVRESWCGNRRHHQFFCEEGKSNRKNLATCARVPVMTAFLYFTCCWVQGAVDRSSSTVWQWFSGHRGSQKKLEADRMQCCLSPRPQ